jgi:hypothetical protein
VAIQAQVLEATVNVRWKAAGETRAARLKIPVEPKTAEIGKIELDGTR